MGSVGNHTYNNSGLGAEWLDFSGSYGDNWNPNVDERSRSYEYLKMLQQENVLPKNIDMEEARKYFVYYGEYNTDEYNSTPFGKMAEGFVKFAEGATTRGYGDNKQEFDSKYGLSKFIDEHKALQLNTDKPMYRGVRTSQKELNELYKSMDSKSAIDMNGISSFTANKNMAVNFTKGTLKPTGDIRVIYKDITKGQRNAMPYPYSGQHEAIYSKSAKFNIVNINKEGNTYIVEIYKRGRK